MTWFDKLKDLVNIQIKDLTKKFGEEGKMISNLCTAGYFDPDGYISQLYKEMSGSPNFDLLKFKEEFRKILP